MIDEPRRGDIKQLHDLIRKAVPELTPYIETGMIGYGRYHYTYASGREGDWAIIGLASQKNYISVYVCGTKGGKYVAETYKKKLPKANIGKSCIRFKKVEDIDLDILEQAIKEGARAILKNKS